MKNTSVLYTLIGLVVGLGIGWFFFQGHSSVGQVEHTHSHSSEDGTIWTCSMDPQVRQNEPGDCPLCGMDLIPLGENTSSDPLVLEMTENAVQLAQIATTTVGSEQDLSGKTLRLAGKIQADERRAASQVAHIPGRIEKLYVSFTGEQVRKGQRLADIYSPALITAQRELKEAQKMAATQPDLLAAARNKLRYWKISTTTIQTMEDNEDIQETFPLYADADGVVTQRRVAVGDHLMAGEPLFDLVNLKRVWGLFDAYEEDLSTISVGNTVQFTTPALPNQTFQAKITFIDPIINPRTRTASLRVEVANPNGRLKPEMLVYGTLDNKSSNSVGVTIPKSAVMWTGERSIVYVKLPDTTVPSFQFREIELGKAQGENYEILTGLEVGEEVVTQGNFVIDAAAQLNNQASMMNRDIQVKNTAEAGDLPNFQAETPEAFKVQLEQLTGQYLLLKDALVATDAAQANVAAAAFIPLLTTVEASLLLGEAKSFWLEQQSNLIIHGQELLAASDVEAQRQQFDFVSRLLIASLQVFGSAENTYYVQYCPMAFDNTGADWLSAEDQVLNPYFGDVMLRCGVVKETLGE